MERRHLIYMSGAGKRPFRRACDRRTFAEVTASEEVRKLRPAQDPVDRMRPHIGRTDAVAVLLAQQRGRLRHARDVARCTVADGRRRTGGRSGRR